MGTATEKVRAENDRLECVSERLEESLIRTPGPIYKWVPCMNMFRALGFKKYSHDGDLPGSTHPGKYGHLLEFTPVDSADYSEIASGQYACSLETAYKLMTGELTAEGLPPIRTVMPSGSANVKVKGVIIFVLSGNECKDKDLT